MRLPCPSSIVLGYMLVFLFATVRFETQSSESTDRVSSAMTKPRGRPLDPEIDDAIVRAAAEQLLAHGIQRMTVPGVAAAAGVAKTTVYRRYSTPAQLALAAIGRLNASDTGPDTGSARDDLLQLLESV